MNGQEMYSVTLYIAMVVAVVPGIVNAEQQQQQQQQLEDSAVLVKINPFISKSRKIIQFGGDRRYKRNGPEKSTLYLEFPESFFEDPKLKRLYRSLTGEGDSRKSKSSDPKNTDIVFQIDPSAFGKANVKGKHKKRDVRGGELAAFQLKIAPAASHVKQMGRGLQGFVPRHETTKAWCLETMSHAEWSPNAFMNEGSKESSTEIVAETMCYPSKPSTPKLRICGGITTENLRSARPNDPCQCDQSASVNSDEQQQVETTPYDLYTQCKSQDPIVTHFVESLCFTTEKCSSKATFAPYAVDVFSTTYKPTIWKPSCPPSSALPPTCEPSTCAPFAPFQRFLRRRKKDNQLRNFFLMSNSPQSCPPFCPPKCTTSKPQDCSTPTTCSTGTTCACTTTAPCTTCSSPASTSKNHFDHDSMTTCLPTSTCLTTSTRNCCPMKRARLDDPLRNVLRLFHRRNPRRVRRNPPSFRRRRRIWVYKPKHGLRKVSFRSNEYAPSSK